MNVWYVVILVNLSNINNFLNESNKHGTSNQNLFYSQFICGYSDKRLNTFLKFLKINLVFQFFNNKLNYRIFAL